MKSTRIRRAGLALAVISLTASALSSETQGAAADSYPWPTGTLAHAIHNGTWVHISPSPDPASVVSEGVDPADDLHDICYIIGADGHQWDLVVDTAGRNGSLWSYTAGWIFSFDLTYTYGPQNQECSSEASNSTNSLNEGTWVHIAPTPDPASVISKQVSRSDTVLEYCSVTGADGQSWILVDVPVGRNGYLWNNTAGWIAGPELGGEGVAATC